MNTILCSPNTNAQLPRIPKNKFITELIGFHELVLDPVDADYVVAVLLQGFGEVAADEIGAAADADALS